jgi:blocked-early-in-transport protein 1
VAQEMSNRTPYSNRGEAAMPDHVDLLSDRVRQLKQVSLQIETEVKEQNRWLTGMEQEFSSAGGLLASTRNKLSNMMKTQSSRYTFYMIFFSLLVMLFIYFMIRK